MSMTLERPVSTAAPVEDGFVDVRGVRTHYDVYGDGEPTLLFLPSGPITNTRLWKSQIPYLARHFRVITFDPRGNGRSDRPLGPDGHTQREHAADAIAVLDATGTDRALVVEVCEWVGPVLAAEHPDRIAGLLEMGTVMRLAPGPPCDDEDFDAVRESYEGWQKENRHYWIRDWAGYLRFFFSECLPEAHSSRQIEEAVSWGLGTTPETYIDYSMAPDRSDTREEAEQICRSIRCPVVVVWGTEDRITTWERSERLAELTNGELVVLEGAGHTPMAREPVATNLLIRDFAEGASGTKRPPVTWTVARNRPRRALFVSSPIGLGHAERDVAIADELRKVRPDLTIEWLAQHPVTEVLRRRGERIHPASEFLASESDHIDRLADEHDLQVFQAFRQMDEILVANFMLFLDVVEEEHFDLWVGDEAWDVDHFLHENPELKRTAFVWLTDFVGWLPMPDGGEYEAALTADYNAEMVEHVGRYPRLRDRSIFVGNPDDIVPDALGPDLPSIRQWTQTHFDFSGFVSDVTPPTEEERAAARARLGYRPDERVCIVTVGGSGTGEHLLRKVIAAYPEAKRALPDLRMVVVTGPRIDPSSFSPPEGLEIRGYVDGLSSHLSVCDVAVVQGGLTTTMELTAARRPFIVFPLAHHFEQNFHVRHRLERYGAGRYMEYATTTPDEIAAAISEEADRTVEYRTVETDGAERAAGMIAELV
jgi:pimeloyl-ACP methyl ester carboxylesterase/predicted glycosyltransferase